MTDTIEIAFRPAEGSVLRLIGLVERRGFEVRGLDLPAMRPDLDARLKLSVRPRDAGRSLETLRAQISRIYGVTGVQTRLAPAIMESAS